MAVEFSASADYGLSGQYIARLTGRAPKVTFAREFIGHKWGKRNEGTTALVDEPALIEVVNVTRKGKDRNYWLVVEHGGELERLRTDEDDAMAIAKRLDGGETITEIIETTLEVRDAEKYPDAKPKLVYAIRSKGESKKAIAQASEAAAVDAICAALESLPAPIQKKALVAAKARLFPVTPKAEVEAKQDG